MITYEQAVQLKLYDIVHLDSACHPISGKRYTNKYRVNGMMKTWKRSPGKFRIPLKHGMYDYDMLTEYNAYRFHLESECPLRKADD